jgi:hypothetical protein
VVAVLEKCYRASLTTKTADVWSLAFLCITTSLACNRTDRITITFRARRGSRAVCRGPRVLCYFDQNIHVFQSIFEEKSRWFLIDQFTTIGASWVIRARWQKL